jgi:hypothetical protein
MIPMLRPNKDIVTIKKINHDTELHENDIVLYKSSNHLVLHRIIKINTNETYDILGDNCSFIEKNIERNKILGILVSFVYDGVKYELNNIRYKKYVVALRRREEKRIKRKYYYDIISKYCSILPSPTYNIIKSLASKILVQQISF